MQDLRNWLNSTRNFDEGSRVYLIHGDDSQFVQLLLAGETPYNRSLLFEKLRDIYYNLKSSQPDGKSPISGIQHIEETSTESPNDEHPISLNTELIRICKSSADKLYKEQMNTRAQLFALCSIKEIPGENEPISISERDALVQQVMALQCKTDSAYAALRFVEEHGTLPDEPVRSEPLPENPILLERMRTNTQKSLNKDKLKVQTLQCVARIQKKEKLIEAINEQISRHISN